MKYIYIPIRVFAPVINIFTFIVNIFIRRDQRIILFGSWMGERYSDNSRYIYQYLSDNKQKYDIKKLIWVTRNDNVYNLLKEHGFEVYMMHSFKSFYYHFKAGIHIICNICFPVKSQSSDIMGQFSGHAIKLDAMHGIAIKAGETTGDNAKKRGVIGNIKYHIRKSKTLYSMVTPGHWDQAYTLSTGRECTRRNAIFEGKEEALFIESGFPRHCKGKVLMGNEKQTIKTINQYSVSILYVPTFRDCGEVPHPLNNQSFVHFLSEQGYFWIEKQHHASKNTTVFKNLKNILYLDDFFDINTIIPYITILVTDYSSAAYDAIAFDKPVLYYIPDYMQYMQYDRGFLCDFKQISSGFNAGDISDLMDLIDKTINDENYKQLMMRKIQVEKGNVLEANKEEMEEVIECIHKRLNILQKV